MPPTHMMLTGASNTSSNSCRRRSAPQISTCGSSSATAVKVTRPFSRPARTSRTCCDRLRSRPPARRRIAASRRTRFRSSVER